MSAGKFVAWSMIVLASICWGAVYMEKHGGNQLLGMAAVLGMWVIVSVVYFGYLLLFDWLDRLGHE